MNKVYIIGMGTGDESLLTFKAVQKIEQCDVIIGGKRHIEAFKNKEKIEMLIKTFFNRLKGYHVQYNVVSKETLLDAQAHPEKHKDLIVRVAGYSAFFNVLSKATQDDIIGRTEQTL